MPPKGGTPAAVLPRSHLKPEEPKLAATILQLSLGHTDGQDNKLVRLFKKRLQHHLPGDSGSILAMQL